MYIRLQSAVNFFSSVQYLTKSNIVLAIYYNKNTKCIHSLAFLMSHPSEKENKKNGKDIKHSQNVRENFN